MLIGEVVKQTGVTRDAVRHYEAQGLLRQPLRRDNNYKDYAADTVDRIRFIQAMQRSGFTLRQTRSFLELHERGAATCGNTGVYIQEHMAALDDQIAQLTAMRARLGEMFRACEGNTLDDPCRPISEAFPED